MQCRVMLWSALGRLHAACLVYLFVHIYLHMSFVDCCFLEVTYCYCKCNCLAEHKTELSFFQCGMWLRGVFVVHNCIFLPQIQGIPSAKHPLLSAIPLLCVHPGAGGCALPMALHRHFPEAVIEAVEIDQETLVMAQRFFGAQSSNQLSLVRGDGFKYLQSPSNHNQV